MELGAAAVLLNTAIATARNPLLMASAFRDAVAAGRKAYLAGLGPVEETASASSPLTGFLG
ncbi:Thiazole synthase [compost metagenome]